MATIKFSEGNQGMYRWSDPNTENYDIISSDLDGLTMVYNGNDGAYDPTRSPYKINLYYEDAESYQYEEGPEAGSFRLIDGTLSKIKYYDDSGNRLVTITDLDMDLSFLDAMLNINSWNFGRAMLANDNLFIGSNDSSGPDSDWGGDDIQTGRGNDIVKARGGDDYIKDAGGKDKYYGGEGRDTLTYDEAFWNPELVKHGIDVRLDEGKITGYDGYVDKVSNIENVRGTYLKDKFVGDGEDNWFMGFAGNDVMNGRGGYDGVSYRNDSNQGGMDGVKVDLANGWARDGFGNKDKLKSIENAQGTDFNDVFKGSSKDNNFRGRDGDDRFVLKKGNDQVNGGDGADKFVFKGTNFGDDLIEDFDASQGDMLKIDAADEFEDLAIYQDGSHTIIEFAGNSVKLYDVNVNDIDESVFIFS